MNNTLVYPYLPTGKVTNAIVSGDISKEIRKSIIEFGIKLIYTETHSSLPVPLSNHVDMQMVNIGDRKSVV